MKLKLKKQKLQAVMMLKNRVKLSDKRNSCLLEFLKSVTIILVYFLEITNISDVLGPFIASFVGQTNPEIKAPSLKTASSFT